MPEYLETPHRPVMAPLDLCRRLLIASALVLGFLRDLLPHLSYQAAWSDMPYSHFLWETARTTWLDYRQVPLWIPTAPSLRDGDAPQVELIPPDAGSVTLATFTPNRLTVDANLDAPAMLVRARRAHRRRARRRNANGRPRFEPRGYRGYAALTLAGVAGCVALRRKRPQGPQPVSAKRSAPDGRA